MKLDAWGHTIEVNEPQEIGSCEACGHPIYEHEAIECKCERMIHNTCVLHCEQCKESGCSKCLLFDEELGHWFCDTAGDKDYRKPKAERLENSECRKAFEENDNGKS